MPASDDPGGFGNPSERVPLIRVSSLGPVMAELDRRGPRADALLATHLMTRAQLNDPYHKVPLARYVAFLEDAARVEGDELLGARVGGQFRPTHLGPVGLLFGASSTLRRGFESSGALAERLAGRYRDGGERGGGRRRLELPP